jgi:hypothetical protein
VSTAASAPPSGAAAAEPLAGAYALKIDVNANVNVKNSNVVLASKKILLAATIPVALGHLRIPIPEGNPRDASNTAQHQVQDHSNLVLFALQITYYLLKNNVYVICKIEYLYQRVRLS